MSLTLSTHHTLSLDESRVAAARSAVDAALAAQQYGFAQLPYQNEEELAAIAEIVAQTRDKYKSVILLGIGGQDLGVRAVHRALNHQYVLVRDSLPKLYFAGDTSDPVPLQELLDVVDIRETLVIVSSKSGGTIETLSNFLYVREVLKQRVGEAYASHIIAITDPTQGVLRELATLEDYRTLPVPPAVGGRWTALCAAGLFPFGLVGIDTVALLAGARHVLEQQREDALQYAALQIAAYDAGRKIHVFMPYSHDMREMGFWFRQLWAESLGKALNRHGEEVHVGPTPVAALGPTDQHSQVQLYREGPADKTMTFLSVQHMPDLHVPDDLPEIEALSYLKGRSFSEILRAELAGTEQSLQEVGTPTFTLTIDQVDAWHIGATIMFFELATTYAGELLNVNAFDQPGVERGKQLTKERLA